jgi:hypothetical protein
MYFCELQDKMLAKPASTWWNLGCGEQLDDVVKLSLKEAIDILRGEALSHPGDWALCKLHELTFWEILGRYPFRRIDFH